MKPPPFEYHAPATVEEALQLLAGGNGTYALAGGQSLVQLMKFRQVKPSALVDLNGVAGLDALEERDGELHVGALVRQQRAARGRARRRVVAAAARGSQVRRLQGDAPPRHRRRLARLRGPVGRADRRRGRARRGDRRPVAERRADDSGALVLPRPERDGARAGRADRPRALPGSRAARSGAAFHEVERPLPRLLPGRGRGGRLARRSGRPRPPPRGADAVPRRRLDARSRTKRALDDASRRDRAGGRHRGLRRAPTPCRSRSRPPSPRATPPKTPDGGRTRDRHDQRSGSRSTDARTSTRSSRARRSPTSSATTWA